MSDRKTIILKSEDLVIPKNTTRKKRATDATNQGGRIKIKSPLKKEQSTMKKRSILRMIREHQEEKYRKLYEKDKPVNKPTNKESSEFDSDFQKSLEYLSKISEEQKPKQTYTNSNTTLKHYGGQFSSIPTSPSPPPPFLPTVETVDMTTSLSPPDTNSPIFKYNGGYNGSIQPQYSSMKGGSMPTYRHWKHQQTQKNMSPLQQQSPTHMHPPRPTSMPIQIQNLPLSTSPSPIAVVEQRAIENPLLKKMIESRKINEKMDTLKKANVRPRMKQKKTIRRTFKLGKSKTYSQVSVLVSNKKIRGNILTKTQQLKTVPIDDIKKFLIKRGFIKVGSTAPNDVLRKMYESVVLICGEVNNHNTENLYHNYLNGGL